MKQIQFIEIILYPIKELLKFFPTKHLILIWEMAFRDVNFIYMLKILSWNLRTQ